MKKLLVLTTLSLIALTIYAQNSKQIILETKNVALVLSIGNNKRVTQSYLGKKYTTKSDYEKFRGGREVYLTSGMENQAEPAIRMIHNDGNPSLELEYASHRTTDNSNVSTTEIIVKDSAYPIQVTLYYTLYKNEDVIKTWAEIRHSEKKPVMMTQYASSLLHFDADEYWLTQFHGDWAREVNMVEEKLTNGIKKLESKLGTRTNFYQTQTFFVSLNNKSTETEGELLAGSLFRIVKLQYRNLFERHGFSLVPLYSIL